MRLNRKFSFLCVDRVKEFVFHFELFVNDIISKNRRVLFY